MPLLTSGAALRLQHLLQHSLESLFLFRFRLCCPRIRNLAAVQDLTSSPRPAPPLRREPSTTAPGAQILIGMKVLHTSVPTLTPFPSPCHARSSFRRGPYAKRAATLTLTKPSPSIECKREGARLLHGPLHTPDAAPHVKGSSRLWRPNNPGTDPRIHQGDSKRSNECDCLERDRTDARLQLLSSACMPYSSAGWPLMPSPPHHFRPVPLLTTQYPFII